MRDESWETCGGLRAYYTSARKRPSGPQILPCERVSFALVKIIWRTVIEPCVRRPGFASRSLLGHPYPQNTMHGIQRAHLPTNAIVADAMAECADAGLLEELRAALNPELDCPQGDARQAVRDLVYELAGASNRDLAVDVLIYATGVAEFDLTSLREYARKHGLTPEGFRQHVLKMQRRLGLAPRPMQHADAN